MTLNNSEFENIRRQDPDEPLDGRDGQPVTEGSSDAPQTLDSEDPLRGTDAVIAQDDELDFEGAAVEADDAERLVEEPAPGDERNPGIDAEREVPPGDRREDPDAP